MLVPDSLHSVVGAAAVVPAVLLLWLVIAADKRPEPPGIIWAAFLLGAASLLMLSFLRAQFEGLGAAADNSWLGLSLRAVIRIAVPEETVKILALCAVAFRHRPFEDPMDMAVYGAAVGLGFAALENISYLSRPVEDWYTLAVVRSVLTVPFHGALGAIAGGYLAAARFGGALGAHRHRHFVRSLLIALMWLIPVVLHALFDLALLPLRDHTDSIEWSRVLQAMTGLCVGAGAITLAIRLIVRIDAHHQPARSRATATAWRAIWAVILAGGAAAFVGAVLVSSALRLAALGVGGWYATPVVSGAVLIAVGIGAFWWGGRHLHRSSRDI